MSRRWTDHLKQATTSSLWHREYQKLCVIASLAALIIFAMTRVEDAPAHQRSGGANPLLSAKRYDPLELPKHRATVKEVLRAGSYHYLLLDVAPSGAPGQAWVVVMGQEAAPGERVEATLWAQLDDFYSPKLTRRFATLQLATITSLTPRSTP